MKYLFDSTGKHIANEVAGHLHAVNGTTIGRFLPQQRIFVDRSGRYLGEIVAGNRLLHNTASEFERARFGAVADAGNAGSFGNPGNAGSVPLENGFVDIVEDRLR